MVRQILLSAGMVAALTGCAARQPEPIATPVEVKVPVATPVYCIVTKLDRPALPIGELKADSAPEDTVRAYAATVAILKGAVEQRDLALAGCAAPAASDPSSKVVKEEYDSTRLNHQ